jgi:indolepyruvate ferredoxin oxidoreductase beta subunit
MKTDIVLCGVGGQGILSIAAVLDRAAMGAGLQVRQPEVHGMAQRGGAVHAFVRISDKPVPCDLPPSGSADLILSVEPMEAMRYLGFLKPTGWVVTDTTPFVNMDGYPDDKTLLGVLFSLPKVLAVDAARAARKAGNPRASNMVMLGAASPWLPFPPDVLEGIVTRMFAAKGDHVVADNLKAFRSGRAAGLFSRALLDAGCPPGDVARVTCRLDLDAAPVDDDTVADWRALLSRPDVRGVTDRVAFECKSVPPRAVKRLLQGNLPDANLQEALASG